MANSYPTPETAMTPSYLQTPLPVQEDLPVGYSLFGPIQYPESVALWHTSSSQQPSNNTPTSATSYSSPASLNQQPILQPAPDQKKHKRTRSGCFTCRSRRIKCDETRPVCERCKKGNRECVYPSSTKTAHRSGAKPKSSRPQSQESDSSGHVEQDDVRILEPIADEEEHDEGSVGSGSRLSPPSVTSKPKPHIRQRRSNLSLRKPRTNKASEPAGDPKEGSSSPSTESSKLESMSASSTSFGNPTMERITLRWNSQLPDDVRFYLLFHQEFLSFHHYFQKQNSEVFIRQGLVDFALQYEPLLYALVGFAAYHHSFQTTTGNLSTFLKYYNKALSLLRKSLGSGEKHSEATLITILVLTTFEVRIALADWFQPMPNTSLQAPRNA